LYERWVVSGEGEKKKRIRKKSKGKGVENKYVK